MQGFVFFFIKMYISEQEICRWSETNPSKRNYIEGKKIANAEHIVKCGKLSETNNNDEVKFVTFCMQTSNLKNKPHEINCSVSCNGKILSMVCTCKAGLGEKCKHIFGTLFYCTLIDLNTLPMLSCTDVKCSWKQDYKRVLETYIPRPIEEHSCFRKKKGN
ncbi:hypothetical protein PV328_007791 [Microctonus aethiopoides]|uniref:SWIM-type domain-containing protein n=1 Tax=Microctonus aethiopoides TaxID=144406 RepID=A0AA39C9I2_9HYME|nr:hypothetical protein PV328_007791 [Microctonus aethiopoides]